MKTMKSFLEDLKKNEFEELGQVGEDSTWLMREDEGTYDVELKEIRGTNDGTVIRGHINFNIPTDYVVDEELLREELKKKIEDIVEFLQNA